ncbi:MAG: hypothetical protein ACYC0V_08545 [Armatimonadota bacterium]
MINIWPYQKVELIHPRHMVLAFVFLILLLSLSVVMASSSITAKQALAKASRNYEIINDYTVDAQLSIDSPSIKIPKTNVKIYYKKPDKVHVDSKDGLAILPKNGLITGNPVKNFITADKLSIAGSAIAGGRDCYVIHANFTKGDRQIETKVWIDKKDWLVMRISANPGYGPSIDVALKYLKVEGKYWLPVYTKANLSIPAMMPEHGRMKPGMPQPSIAIIRFANYHVNKGINDSIFNVKPERGN